MPPISNLSRPNNLNTNNSPAAHHLSFVRSGYLELTNKAGVFRYTGYSGDYWPSRSATADKDRAYYLAINTGVRPLGGPSDRYQGLSLRCLSADLEG